MDFLSYLQSENIISNKEASLVKDYVVQEKLNLDDAIQKANLPQGRILEAKSKYYDIPYRNLGDVQVPFDILKYIPEESAVHYQIAPIDIKDGFLEVGMVNPDDIEARDALNFLASKSDTPYKIALISKTDFENILRVYRGLSGEVTRALTELESEMTEEEKFLQDNEDKKARIEDTKIIEDAPVAKIVATIIRYAVDGNASDVHIEPLAERVRVRFRVDGVLNTSLILPLKVNLALVARIKLLTRTMKLDEKRRPQDGRFSARAGGRRIDFRVSTFPTAHGEKIVLRILDQEKGIKPLEELGLSPRYLAMLREAITKPFGMILISGPTGSGKTTTLYSILNEIDREKNNVLSLEDPVEYSVEGVSQSQIFEEIGYTFANGLRTTLRQDPDIILVGEIRDAETAKLAIQASLTGHLVLSTIHTNTATGIVPRLIDLGVDPFLIPPTLILGIAQRLVRKICPGGGKSIKVEDSIKEMYENQFKDLPDQYHSEIPPLDEILEIQTTPDCPSGIKGREAVFEMYEMNKDLEKVILGNPVESEIYKTVRKDGLITMREDAMIKSLRKEIPFEEVNKL
jgi:type IV pilus assembly protein PilB